MITLVELFEVSLFPLMDMDTGEKVDSKVVLKHPDAKVESLGFDTAKLYALVKYEKEGMK